jgi:hypothetical protein
LRASSLGQDDCHDIVECWYFVSLLLPLLKLLKVHSLNYSDVTQKSIGITLLFGFVIYVMYYALLLW